MYVCVCVWLDVIWSLEGQCCLMFVIYWQYLCFPFYASLFLSPDIASPGSPKHSSLLVSVSLRDCSHVSMSFEFLRPTFFFYLYLYDSYVYNCCGCNHNHPVCTALFCFILLVQGRLVASIRESWQDPCTDIIHIICIVR